MQSKETIYWIGGSACSGKSTLAKMYAEKYRLELYSCDDHFNSHVKTISMLTHPAMYKVATMSANEAFYIREIDEQVRVYIQSFQEDFSFVIKDLAKMGDIPIVVEGNQLLPSLVQPYLNDNHKAIWVIPSENFQREYYRRRNWIHEVLKNTENPEIAFTNWMTRDALFGKLVLQEAADLNLQIMHVDGSMDISRNFKIMEDHFKFD